jgi:hypothetical protein
MPDMKPDYSRLSNEDLKRLLHTENYNFNMGLERGLSFNELKEIRQTIRAIHAEIEARNLASIFNPSSN